MQFAKRQNRETPLLNLNWLDVIYRVTVLTAISLRPPDG